MAVARSAPRATKAPFSRSTSMARAGGLQASIWDTSVLVCSWRWRVKSVVE